MSDQNELKTERLVVRITGLEKTQAKTLASGEGRSLSNYITELIRRDMEKKRDLD